MPSNISLGINSGVAHPLNFSFPSPGCEDLEGWEEAQLQKSEGLQERILVQLLVA